MSNQSVCLDNKIYNFKIYLFSFLNVSQRNTSIFLNNTVETLSPNLKARPGLV